VPWEKLDSLRAARSSASMMRHAVYTIALSIPAVIRRCVGDCRTGRVPGAYLWFVMAICAEVRTYRRCYNAAFRMLR